jgi:hypothetical protein
MKTLIRQPWKGPQEVEHLSIQTDDEGHLKELGRGNRGIVYLGRLKFGDGSDHRVAVKRFTSKPLTDEEAKSYEDAVNALRAHGVSLPKTGLIKLKMGTSIGPETLKADEWVQVQELYMRSGESKIAYLLANPGLPTNVRQDAVVEFTRIANAGYPPHGDIVKPLKLQDHETDLKSLKLHESVTTKGTRWGVIPFDLDMAVEDRNRSPEHRAKILFDLIRDISKVNPGEFQNLLKTALGEANDEMRPRLKNEIGSYGIIRPQ